MELAVSDADATLKQIQSDKFIPTLDNLPNEISISNIDLSDDSEGSTSLEKSSASRVMMVAQLFMLILMF